MPSNIPSRVTAVIDVAALKHNLQRVREHANGAKIMAVLKANAYGHGLETVAAIVATEVDALAVAAVDELVRLTDLPLASKPGFHIAVLSGIFSREVLTHAVANGGAPVIHNACQLGWLLSMQELKTIKNVWVKVDSGMHRLGFEAEHALAALRSIETVAPQANVRLMSHLANADDCNDEFTNVQISAFSNMIQNINVEISMCNSPAILANKCAAHEWVRPGLMLYGASPVQGKTAALLRLKPVMTLTAKLLSIKSVSKGERVGYGGTWVAPRDTKLGIVSCGYGDGYPRVVDGKACVLIHGSRARLCGRVSMDVLSVDVSDIEEANIGDDVILWGEGLPVDEVAAWANTIPYELLCKVTSRVPRVVLDLQAENIGPKTSKSTPINE